MPRASFLTVEVSSVFNSWKMCKNIQLSFVMDFGILRKKQTGEITDHIDYAVGADPPAWLKQGCLEEIKDWSEGSLSIFKNISAHG